MHDVGCRCTLNGVTFSYLQQKYEPTCTLNRVTFTYLKQKYKALILDNVVRAPSIVAGGLLQYPQTKGDPFSVTYGEHFSSKAGVLSTELPSLIFVRFKPSHFAIHTSRGSPKGVTFTYTPCHCTPFMANHVVRASAIVSITCAYVSNFRALHHVYSSNTQREIKPFPKATPWSMFLIFLFSIIRVPLYPQSNVMFNPQCLKGTNLAIIFKERK